MQQNLGSKRIVSIDIFRALVMFLMIFVNDFWTLSAVPEWLQHKDAFEDGIGFSDVIFPAFLFIVGLSIPFAIKSRRDRLQSNTTILKHVFKRACALIIMGLFMVNFENINSEGMIINKDFWETIMVFAIFLVWLNYKPFKVLGKKSIVLFQSTGVVLFIFLALIYQGGLATNVEWMKVHWWGILGLIGWTYLFNVVIYVYLGRKFFALVIAFIVFQLLNVQEFFSATQITPFKLIVSASMHASVCAGMIIGRMLLNYQKINKTYLFIIGSIIFTFIIIVYGFALRPYWGGFSKIRATPSWISVCIGISALSFLIIYIIVDKFNFRIWAKPIKIAGTNTLTCYVMPYLVYPIMIMTGTLYLPESIINGNKGLLKSLLFSFVIIQIVWILNKLKIKLKI